MPAKSQLEIEVKAKDDASAKLKTIGLNAQQMAKTFAIAGASMIAVGGAIVGGLFKIAQQVGETGEQLLNLSTATGISVEELSKWKYICEAMGVPLDTYTTAIKNMQIAISNASTATDTSKTAIGNLGISISDLMKTTPDQQFATISAAIQGISDKATQVDMMQSVFGRSAQDLAPAILTTRDNIDLMKQAAIDAGVVFTTDTATVAASYDASMDTMKGAIEGLKTTIALSVMPVMQQFIDQITEKLKPAMAWLQEHPEVVQAFLKFGAIFGVTGAVFLGVSAFIKLINLSLIPAIFRAIVAWIGLLSVSGPAGWAILAGSVMVATAAIVALWEVLAVPLPSRPFPAPGGGQAVPPGYTTWEEAIAAGILPAGPPSPSYQYGGIVPGTIGKPIPIIAHGGEMFAVVHGAYRGGIEITVINNIQGSVITERDLVQTIREEFLKIQARNEV